MMKKGMKTLLTTALLFSAMGESANIHISETDRKVEELEHQLKNAKRRKHKMRIIDKIEKLKSQKYESF